MTENSDALRSCHGEGWGNYSAYAPDLPGCVATGASVDAVEADMREAIRFHTEGLKADGLDVPKPTSIADYIEA